MKMQSKVDPYTFYTVTSSYVRICRHGDKLTMSYMQIPEQAKRFNPKIQEELMGFYKDKHPLIPCPHCGKLFRKEKGRKYCCQECQDEAAKKRKREREKNPKERECKWCGKVFVTTNYQQFCSNDCRNADAETKKQERSEFRKTKQGHLDEKLKQAAAAGTSYAEMQRHETLKMVGRVVI